MRLLESVSIFASALIGLPLLAVAAFRYWFVCLALVVSAFALIIYLISTII